MRTAVQFWARVEQSGECWLWMGSRLKQGYGVVNWGGKTRKAHRVAWELHNGFPPDQALDCCHRCDNPPCVNPAHLFLGTAKDNMLDMVAKGRCIRKPQRGEANGAARLTNERVIEARALYAAGGVSFAELAPRFGVSTMTIYRAIRGSAWSHLSSATCAQGSK